MQAIRWLRYSMSPGLTDFSICPGAGGTLTRSCAAKDWSARDLAHVANLRAVGAKMLVAGGFRRGGWDHVRDPPASGNRRVFSPAFFSVGSRFPAPPAGIPSVHSVAPDEWSRSWVDLSQNSPLGDRPLSRRQGNVAVCTADARSSRRGAWAAPETLLPSQPRGRVRGHTASDPTDPRSR
jgi:hypothetical protein